MNAVLIFLVVYAISAIIVMAYFAHENWDKVETIADIVLPSEYDENNNFFVYAPFVNTIIAGGICFLRLILLFTRGVQYICDKLKINDVLIHILNIKIKKK